MSIPLTPQPPSAPPQPPIQKIHPISHGSAQDLELNDETVNQLSNQNSSNNSPVYVNQNSYADFEPDFLDQYLTITPTWQAAFEATSDTRGNAFFTARVVHNFGGDRKYARRYRALREKQAKQRIAIANLNAKMAQEKHCVQMRSSGYSTPECEHVVQKIVSSALPRPRIKKKPQVIDCSEEDCTGKEIKGLW